MLRFETWLGRAACAAMAVFFAGACAWVDHSSAPTARGSMAPPARGSMAPPARGGRRGLFRPGLIDVAGLVVLALALAVARQAAGQARAGAR